MNTFFEIFSQRCKIALPAIFVVLLIDFITLEFISTNRDYIFWGATILVFLICLSSIPSYLLGLDVKAKNQTMIQVIKHDNYYVITNGKSKLSFEPTYINPVKAVEFESGSLLELYFNDQGLLVSKT